MAGIAAGTRDVLVANPVASSETPCWHGIATGTLVATIVELACLPARRAVATDRAASVPAIASSL